MGKRRDGREAAIQYLYQLDLNGQSLSATAADFWAMRVPPGASPAPERTQMHAQELVAGVQEHLAEIDERLGQLSANYKIERIAAVDRNILRAALYEMLFCTDVPPVVVINEAIEIAKRFGSEDSGRFVNGILDRLRSDMKRAPREPAASPAAPSL